MADCAHPALSARHNRGVKVVCVVLLTLLVTSVAYAHPRRDDDMLEEPFFDRFDRHDRDFRRMKKTRPVREPTPEELCERNKSWTRLVACLKKGGNTVSILTD